jgi:hypothetical protein
LPRERLSNLASSSKNTPSGCEELDWNEGLSKQHNKKNNINRNDYFVMLYSTINRLLSRSCGNDHGVSASFENGILDKQNLLCVTGIAQIVNKPCSFKKGTFILLLGNVKFIALLMIPRRNIGLDVGKYIR